jgi:hypothetical protein
MFLGQCDEPVRTGRSGLCENQKHAFNDFALQRKLIYIWAFTLIFTHPRFLNPVRGCGR